MGCNRRLDKAFKHAPVLPLDNSTRYVIFSDCHRGNGTNNDNFLKNQHLYLAALKQYYREGFTYIELGDGDELWENRNIEQIKEIHSDVFHLLSRFYSQKRLYMLYGNHDMVKKYARFSKKKWNDYFCTAKQCRTALFPEIKFYPALILRNPKTGKELYLTHGHQAALLNSTLWRVNCFLVRYIWKPLEQTGILDPTSAAKNYTTKQRTERRLTAWAEQHGRILITGHTHRPMAGIDTPNYINSGSCVHPCSITCIELCGTTATLVKWYMGTRENGDFYLDKSVLANITQL